MKVWILQIPRIDNELSWGLREAANLFEKQNVEVEIINFNDTIYKNFFNTDIWSSIEEFGVLGKGKDKLPMQKIEKHWSKKIEREKVCDKKAFCD